MAITTKSTKAELLQHIEELNTLLIRAEREVELTRPVPLKERAAAAVNELTALVEDAYRFGAWCRKGFDRVLTELRTLH